MEHSTAHESTIGIPPGQPWRLRFWLIWSGQALSLLGSALTQFILLWWITLNVGTPSSLAIAGVMLMLPQALLSPLGGILADRWSRRGLMIAADTISALCMLVLIWLFQSEQIQLWHLYTMMFIRSSMQAFQAPASAASTAMLVPSDWIGRVAGMNQMLQGLMTIAAAPLGALLIAFLPLHFALSIDVVTALMGIVPLFFFAIPQPKRQGEPTSAWRDLVTGARVITLNRGLLTLYGLVALVVLTIMPTFMLTPLLVTEHFQRGVNAVALMEGLSGVGVIVGGIAISMVNLRRRRVPAVLFSFAISCAAVALTALASVEMFWLAVVWWIVSGITFSTGNAPLMAFLQSSVPNAIQGRVISLLTMVMGLAGPIGMALAGLLGEFVGVRGIFIIGGFSAAAICLLGFLLPSLMKLEQQPIRLPDDMSHDVERVGPRAEALG